jgi:hypothetical protein
MDPVSLAGAVVAVLGPYLARMAGRVADAAGDELARAPLPKLGRLHDAIRRRLAPGTYEGNLLTGVEERPEHEGRRRALADALAETLEQDERFASELERLLEDVRASGDAGTRIGRVEGPVAVGGSVVQRGRNVAGHDLVIGGEKRP